MRSPSARRLQRWILPVAIAAAGIAGADELPFAISVEQVQGSGALFADSFDGPRLDQELWWVAAGEPGVRVEIGDGELRIHGKTGPARPSGYNHVGLFSKMFRDPDAVAVARIRIPEPIAPSESDQAHRYAVHLCGAQPDYNSTVFFGTHRGRLGWFLRIRGWTGIAVSGLHVPPTGRETNELVGVRVEHLDGVSTGYVEVDGVWKRVGSPSRVAHGMARLELKAVIDRRDQPVDMRVADARLYPHPAKTPARVVISNDSLHDSPRLRAYRDSGLALKLIEQASNDVLATAVLDGEKGEFVLKLDPKRIYPIPATLVLENAGAAIAKGAVGGSMSGGIYPGGVYTLYETRLRRPDRR